MGGKKVRCPLAAAVISPACLLLLAAFLFAGCGGGPTPQEKTSEVVETATAFLNACGDRQVEEVRSYLSQDYLESNQVPDPITGDDLVAALGYVNSYRMVPEEDISVEGDRAVVSVTLDIQGKGEREETLILRRQDGGWKVDGFTAVDWTSEPVPQGDERVRVEQALRDFVTACIDQRTDYIFEHLGKAYREKYRLEKPWTSAEFSGIFGTARSYDFNPAEIDLKDGAAEVDLTIEFGTRGNLESETARARLVRDGRDWLVDIFPFFIY
jgi:hypothetical protein